MTDARNTRVGWVQGLMEFAFPPLCPGCGNYHDDISPICEVCISRWQRFEFPICLTCAQPILNGANCASCHEAGFILFALAEYQDPLKEVIIQLKFHGVTSTVEFLSGLLVDKFGGKIFSFQPNGLVPIPLHPVRQHMRGYNQAELIAKALAKPLGLEVDTDSLYRVKKGQPHSRLRDAERGKNIRGAFETAENIETNRTIILIDDVVTGGYTAREAKRVLEEAGVEVPAIIALAHGL